METALTVLKASADPTRLRILTLLRHAELAVSDLTRILRQSQPRVSRHLKILAEAGLIEEKALAVALAQATPKAEAAVATEDYEGAMAALAEIRPAVDAFFDKVTVNDPDPALRANRLKLLNQLRQATRAVADFDRIAG